MSLLDGQHMNLKPMEVRLHVHVCACLVFIRLYVYMYLYVYVFIRVCMLEPKDVKLYISPVFICFVHVCLEGMY